MNEASEGKPRLAYLTNVYPAPSHSFVRREIRELEQLGYSVRRFSVRRTADLLKDPDDQAEAAQTTVLLKDGPIGLVWATLRVALSSPVLLLKTCIEAAKLGRRSDRGLAYNMVYLAEACLLRGELTASRIDHLHAHFGTNSAMVAMFCKMLGGPSFSFTVHGPEEFDKATVLSLHRKIQLASLVIAISQFGRSQLYRWCDYEQWQKIHIVRCGLDDDFLESTPTPVPTNATFVCVGRLCEQKGQLLLIDALARLHGLGLSATLTLVGDGPMRAAVESRIDALKLSDAVRITGWASGATVRHEIGAGQIFVLPSFAEGLPVVIMEAMALGRPVISTYIAGIPELIRPGENGWLVPAGDVDALVAAMRDALQTLVERLTEMGSAGRQSVSEKHNIHTEATKLATLFCQSVSVSEGEDKRS